MIDLRVDALFLRECFDGLLQRICHVSKLHFQIRARHEPERHAVLPAIVAVNQHARRHRRRRAVPEERLPVNRFPHHDLGATAGEALDNRSAPRSGRSSPGDDTSRVYATGTKSSTSSTALRSRLTFDAIRDADALLGGRRRPGPVDLHPEHHAAGFAAELHVENLQAVAVRDTRGRTPGPARQCRLRPAFRVLKQKKWAHAHFGPTTKAPNTKYSTRIAAAGWAGTRLGRPGSGSQRLRPGTAPTGRTSRS